MFDRYSDKKVYVTGSDGFIGDALCEAISSLGKPFVRIDRNHSLFEELEKIDKREESLQKELVLCDWNGVYKDRDSIDLQMENAERWKSIAKCAVQHGFSRILALGSQAEITFKQSRVKATEEFQPRNAYGKAKREAFRNLEKVTAGTSTEVAWARLFSVYGPGMSEKSLIISIVSALIQGKEIEISEGEQDWNFLYVEDCATALISILDSELLEPIYNVASEKTHTVREVAKFLGEEMGNPELIKLGAKPYSQDEVFDMSPDISNLVKTGWQEKVDLKSGLKSTIRHFREGLARN